MGPVRLGLALTSGSLAVLKLAAPAANRWLEISVLVAANLCATVLRFLLMRVWVFGGRHRPPPHRPGSAPRPFAPAPAAVSSWKGIAR